MDVSGGQERFQKHLRVLQEAVRAFFQFEIGLDETLKIGLKALLDDIDFDSVYIFLYDEPSISLECVQARMKGKGIIAGESRITVKEDGGGILSDVFTGKSDSAVWDDGLQVCLPLRTFDDKIGVIIADKLISRNKITNEEIDMLSDYAREFSRGIRHIKVFQTNLCKIEMLLALSKISEAMASAIELNPVLEIILKSAVEVLRFDRAKLYLMDTDNNLLKGVASADIRKVVRPIEMEQYKIEKGVNRIVSALFDENTSTSGVHRTDDLFLCIPLMVKKVKIGVLVVDNVFSQQPITAEDKENLDILANQAAITIEKARLYEEVRELSIRDSLTGLFVHNFFLTRLEEEVKRSGREKKSFALIIIDIDGFKRYNDLYGHQVGDTVITTLSQILKQNIRTFDVKGRPIDAIGRYGGDEFVVLLTNSGKESSCVVSKRLRDAVKAQKLEVGDKPVAFTVSLGISIYPQDGSTPHQLFKKADDALYWAKQHGKDQLCFSEDIGKENSKEIL